MKTDLKKKILSTTSLANSRKPPFKYCVRDIDRHGNVRFYVRLPGKNKYRMKATYLDQNGSVTEEFTVEYHNLISGKLSIPTVKTTPEKGTLNWLVDQYYQSKSFQENKPNTKQNKRQVLDKYCKNVGHLPFKKMRRSDIEASQMKRREKPGAADKLVKYLKRLFNWAIEEGLADFNPTQGISKLNKDSEGIHAWTEREVEKFRQEYPTGTKARLAIELYLNLGVRISDVVKLGPSNIVNGRIEFRPIKGSSLKLQPLISLPITQELSAELALLSTSNSTFLVSEYGKPYSAAGFGNRMRKWCDHIGLRECSSHGLRKASATVMAEAGATEYQLMATFGWTDHKMAQHYIKTADSKRLIDAAFECRQSHIARKNVPLLSQDDIGGTKKEKNDDISMPF